MQGTPDEWHGMHGISITCPTVEATASSAGASSAAPPACGTGSIINIDSQSVAENVDIAGTPFFLNYSSLRAVGKESERSKTIKVLPNTVASSFVSRAVTLEFAGKTVSYTCSVSSPCDPVYVWDGLDNSGNRVVGSALLKIRTIDTQSPADPHEVESVIDTHIGSFFAVTAKLGGWTLSVHHFYDRNKTILFRGDGTSFTNGFKTIPGGFIVASEDGTEIYYFDYAGKHLSTKTGLKGATKYTFAYDTADRLTSVTDAFSNVTTINYDSSGNPQSIVGPYGHTTSIQVDSNGYISQIVSPASETVNVTYYAGGLLHTFEKPNGVISTMTYAADGSLQSDSSTAGNGLSLSKTGTFPSSYTVTAMSAEGIQKAYAILQGNNGNYTRARTGPGWLSSTDGVTTNPGSGGYSTKTFYSDLGITTNVNYGSDPRLPFHIYPNNVTTNTMYLSRNMQFNRSVTLTDPDDIYSAGHTTESYVLNWSKTSSREYYATGSMYIYTSPLSRQQVVLIDSYERPISVQRASYTPTTIDYDSRGRMSTIAQGMSRTTTLAYDSSGNLQSVTNPLSQTKTFGYDSVGRITSETLPDSRVIAYAYDANGNLASVTPPAGLAHTILSNGFDLISKYTAPAITFMGLEAPVQETASFVKGWYQRTMRWFANALAGYFPKAAKRVTMLVVNRDTEYTYDNDRKLTSITRPDGATAVFNYSTTTGRLTGITTSSGNYLISPNAGYDYNDSTESPDGVSQAYTFDGPFLRSATNSGATSGVVYFTYNYDFLLATTKINTAGAVSYAYDNDGLVTTAGAETITRNSATGFATKAEVDDVSENYTYSTAYGELASIQGKYSTSTNIYQETMTRDDLARVVSKAETVGSGSADTYTYTFDSAGRLNGVTKNSAAYSSYTYDSNSNRTSVTRGGVTTTATYDEQDRIETFGTKTYAHNDAGELISVTDAATSPVAVTTYTYDVFGNIKSATLPNGTVVSYLLDGQNRRVGRKVNGTMDKQFVWFDQLRPAAELDSSGTLVSQFIYGVKPNVPDYIIKSGSKYKVITDHLGSVVAVVESTTGVVAQALSYDEFGRVLTDSAPGFQPFGFAGGIYDSDTKLVTFGARTYEAETGRWLSKDPILFKGGDVNLYGYVMNDPINLFDPDGLHASVKEDGGAGEPIGGGTVYVAPNGQAVYAPHGSSVSTTRSGTGLRINTPNGTQYRLMDPTELSPNGYGKINVNGQFLDSNGQFLPPGSSNSPDAHIQPTICPAE